MPKVETVSAGSLARQRRAAFNALLQITREVLGDLKPEMPKVR